MNRLAGETSPYLRQHRDNPVDWFAWGEEAFAAARDRDRPILLSVGYSACHWCHLMAHECFEDDETAALMNEVFVNIKVDREERPDVDAVYMDAVQAMTGRGGWPMTVMLRPDGSPFYGGTYFPKPQFQQLIRAIDDVWNNRRADLDQNVAALLERLEFTVRIAPVDVLPSPELVTTALEQLTNEFDPTWGGFGTSPKFPNAMHLELIMRTHGRESADGGDGTGDATVRGSQQLITTTLDAMASGGMYDHIGGGFARYSVDQQWLVPHFEKMLYDQALLARAYLHGWLLFGHPHWRTVVEETVEFVLRELRDPSGGFYAAYDADSSDDSGASHEGQFYTWSTAEVRDVLGDDADEVLEWYEMTGEPIFDGRHIPHRLTHRGALRRPERIEAARAKLFAARERRPQPLLDDKVLAEWNALMLATLAEAAAVLARSEWLEAAVANGEFVLRALQSPTDAGRYARSWQAESGARHAAVAADYAALVDAFTRLAEATGQARWIDAAIQTADQLLDHFWDPEHGGLFTIADDGEQLIARQKDLFDNATPSANSLAAAALVRLAALTGEQRYGNHADQILRLGASLATRSTGAFSHLLAALDMRHSGLTEVVVVGDRPDLVAAAQRSYHPNIVLAWGEPYESPLWQHRADGFAYVCEKYTCLAPESDPNALSAALAAHSRNIGQGNAGLDR